MPFAVLSFGWVSAGFSEVVSDEVVSVVSAVGSVVVSVVVSTVVSVKEAVGELEIEVLSEGAEVSEGLPHAQREAVSKTAAEKAADLTKLRNFSPPLLIFK
ncbi:MAG: hypothetical protein E7386_03505 [Ruminococcaceae bacterium]|nr:hypothetical protein [Oscillospiraceae bacterium]